MATAKQEQLCEQITELLQDGEITVTELLEAVVHGIDQSIEPLDFELTSEQLASLNHCLANLRTLAGNAKRAEI